MAARILTEALPIAYVGSVYSFRVQTADIPSTVTWSLTGAPTGFSINASTGVISGSSPADALVGTYAMTVSFSGAQSDSAAIDLTIRPKEYQRVAKLVLDPRVERLASLFASSDVGPEEIAAHFSGNAKLPASPNDSPSYSLYPNVYLADRLLHSSDQISYEDLRETITTSTDTRSVKEVIDELYTLITGNVVNNIGDGVEIFKNTVSNVAYLRSLTGQQGITISATTNDINFAAIQPFGMKLDPWTAEDRNGVPAYSIMGEWKCGHENRSPKDSYFANSGGVKAFSPGTHRYPFWTFGALDIFGFPHNNGNLLQGGGSIVENMGYFGYQEGPLIPADTVSGVTVPFKMAGKIRSIYADTFVEFVLEPNVSLSPVVFNPSPLVDRRMLFNTEQLGVTWSQASPYYYRPFTFEGSVTWHTYQSWSWTGTFNIDGLYGGSIFKKTVGGSYTEKVRSPLDPNYFSYKDGAVLTISYRIDRWPNRYAWNNTYQGSPGISGAGNVLIMERLDWNK